LHGKDALDKPNPIHTCINSGFAFNRVARFNATMKKKKPLSHHILL